MIAGHRKIILDACALLAYLADEDGASEVQHVIDSEECFIHAVNVCEVYYDLVRTLGKVRADEVMVWITDEAGIAIREDMDAEFRTYAGLIKAELRRVSLADCFCAALSKRLDATVVTCDRKEFTPIAQQSFCADVLFIR